MDSHSLLTSKGAEMSNQSLQKEILDQLSKLPIEQQRQVLDFARTLAKPIGKQGKDLLHFAGGINAEDLKLMSQAIEEGCEQVNINEW
jgi:hypothetical protein